ncbi:MAG: hypothetical protein V4773_04270 [Verrucomicrobiota bacterium]
MKKLIPLILALCALIPLAASAAEPVVVVENTGNVTVNGSNAGAVADVAANNPSLAPAIQAALVTFLTTVQSEASATIAAATAAADAQRDAAIAAKNQEVATLTARVAALEQYRTTVGTYIAGLRGTISGLGGTSEAPPTAP